METCYKVFRSDVIKKIEVEENRFGFEPEIVAKVANLRLRIFEIGISYSGRTYDEGKKIGAKDGFRALYCIVRYNAHTAPLPIQFLFYIFVGGTAAIANLLIFLAMLNAGIDTSYSAPTAYILAAVVNYILCVTLLFKHNAKWSSFNEIFMFVAVVAISGLLDLWMTQGFMAIGMIPSISKMLASLIGLVFNFIGRRFFVFPEPASGPWKS
jgi:putative flippase GtrA